ncbi:MAG: SdpI family protein [Flavobacteriales bacterium]
METFEIITHLLVGPLMVVLSLIFIYFPPKTINALYGHRTTFSMINQDTWDEANKRSPAMIFIVSAATCIIQLTGIIFGVAFDTILIYACIFLIAGLVVGAIVVERQIRTIFDKEGNRK